MKKLTLFLLGLITSFGVMAQGRATGLTPEPDNPNVRVIVSQDQATRSIQDATSRRDNTAPTISISSPATNSSYVAGTNISIVTAASDNVGVTRVDLKVNNVTKYTKTTSPWTFTWATSGLGAGSYSITATAYDAAGNNKTSTAIIIKLTAAPPVGDTTKPIFIGGGLVVDGKVRPPDTVNVYTGVASNITTTVIEEKNLTNCTFSVNNVIQSSQAGFAYPTISKAYTFAWTPSGITYKPGGFGYATLTLKATDAAGNYATISRVVKVVYTFVDTTHYPAKYSIACPPAMNQGGEGACGSVSSIYYAGSINQYYKTHATSYSYSTNILSPEFVHDICTTRPDMIGCSLNGNTVSGAFDVLINRGCCLWSSLPYSYLPQGCQTTSTLPCPAADSCVVTNTMRTEAANYKAKNYIQIVTSDTGMVKYFLYRNHAVVLGITLPTNSEWSNGPDSNFVLNSSTFSGCYSAGHAVTIVGWDDDRQAFKIVNSWGSNWGNFGGSCWVGYDMFVGPFITKTCNGVTSVMSPMGSYYSWVLDPFEY